MSEGVEAGQEEVVGLLGQAEDAMAQYNADPQNGPRFGSGPERGHHAACPSRKDSRPALSWEGDDQQCDLWRQNPRRSRTSAAAHTP